MARPLPSGPPPAPPVQRLTIRYAKRGRMRFASHRDVARAMERGVRKAGVPVAYSAGFSPHPRISYSGGAPTGSASEAEYLELAVTRRCEPDDVGRRLNAAAFSVPASGQQGNLPRNYFRAFPIDQTDLALSRQINITERVTLYLRVEYFNIFNHPMFSPYGNIFVGSPDFGTITQTLNKSLSGLNPLYQIGGPRSGQLTLKLQF